MSDTSLTKKNAKLTANRYKLLIPFHAHRPGDPLSRQSTVLSDAEDTFLPSPQKSLIEPQKQAGTRRRVIDPITNKHVKVEIDIVQQYLREIGIPTVLESSTTNLLLSNVLPYNPYPGFVRKFRRLSERFHIKKQPLSEIKRKLDFPLFNLPNGLLVGAQQKNTSIWGLDHIIGHVHPSTLQSYNGLITSATISAEEASSKTNQQVSVLTSVFGPAVFNNSFYHDVRHVDVKVTVLVTSAELRNAARIFARVVVEDMKKAHENSSSHLLDFLLPIEEKGGWQNRTFSRSELIQLLFAEGSETSDFEKLMVNATVARKRLSLNILLLDHSSFLPTNKLYDFLLLQSPVQSSTESLGRRQLASFPPRLVPSTLPYQALLEGVFLDRSQAELYVSTFQKFYTVNPNAGAGTKKAKAGPMQPEILNAVTEAWQMKIASKYLEHDAFSTVHYILLLHLTQARTKTFSKHSEDDLAIQICRFSRGTASKLNALMSMHSVVEKLLASSTEDQNELVMNVLVWYNAKLVSIFEADMCSRSSEMKTLQEYIQRNLNLTTGSANVKQLHQLYHSLSTVTLGLVEDAFDNCPAILSFKARINASYQHLVPQSAPVGKRSRRQHGVKMQGWINVDYMVLDKQMNIANSQAPKSVVDHYTAMKYCADVRLDVVWREFTEHLLLMEGYLPPNPYPILVTILRKASMSVQVLFENDSTVTNRILQKKITSIEGLTEVCNVSGTAAFGQKSALIFFNLLGFRQVSELTTQVLLAPPGETITGLPLILGTFQVIVCGGLVSPSGYFGSVSPFLTSLDIDEHCFLTGPPNQVHSGATALAKIVLSHLRGLLPNGAVLHQARFGDVTLNLRNLVSASARFESEFSAAVSGSQFVTISFFYPMSWRYVLVRKRMLVYFSDEGSNRMNRVFTHSSATDKRKVSIFLHPDDAIHCMRSGKILKPSLKQAAEKPWISRDWSFLMKQLTSNLQIMFSDKTKKGGNAGMSEDRSRSLLAFCYRYYNSTPGQIDYLMSLNTSLEGLLEHATSTLEESGNVDAVINPNLLGQMIDEYKVKLNEIVSRDSTLAAGSLSDLLLSKLQSIADRDRNSDALYVKYNKQSIEAFQEVNGHLLSLRISAAEDLISASPTVLTCLNDL